MDMNGEYRIEASRDRVWAALNDPEILRQCIPGCEEINQVSPTELTAKVTAKVGPVKAKFAGKVTFSDVDPPNGYRISGEGTGGAAGFAKGGASVKLAEDGGGTILTYVVDAHIGGKLAQIGSRLIDATSRKMADDFFKKFRELVEGADGASESPSIGPAPAVPAATLAAELTSTPIPDPASQVPPAPIPAAATETAPQPRPTPAPAPAPAPAPRSGLSPMVWVAGLAIVVVAVLWYMNR